MPKKLPLRLTSSVSSLGPYLGSVDNSCGKLARDVDMAIEVAREAGWPHHTKELLGDLISRRAEELVQSFKDACEPALAPAQEPELDFEAPEPEVREAAE